MRQQNVIVFFSGKNKRIAHEIVRTLDCGVCKAVVWDEFFVMRRNGDDIHKKLQDPVE